MRDSASDNLIEISNVSKEFCTGDTIHRVLNNVSLTIPRGGFTIIHGPSGSGKTTLLNTIIGLDKPTSGKVSYRGTDIYGLTPGELAHFRARTMGVVYQTNYWVASLSVLENVALPLFFLGYDRSEAETEALASLKQVKMEQHADKLPSVLSGGEQQRVSMARALVSRPTYIVADEPTGNLDSKNGRAIMDLLKYCNEELGNTIVLITHNLDYLPMGSQVLEVRDGEVVETKRHQSIANEKRKTTIKDLAQNIFKSSDRLKTIKLRNLLHIAFKNMKFKRFRSLLTILGVVIGIGSIFTLLSFGLGLQDLVQNEIAGSESVKVVDVSSPNSELIELDATNLERIQNVANIERIGSLNTSAGQIEFESAKTDAVVYGVDENYLEQSNLAIVKGRQLDAAAKNEVLINKSFLESLGYEDLNLALEKKITISLSLPDGSYPVQEPFSIVGVIESGSGSVLYIPRTNFADAGQTVVQQVKLSAADDSDIGSIRQQLESFGFETSSPLDTIDQVNRFFGFLNVVLVSFGGIGMLIAVLGMLNTLTISLLERTKEIGIMVALGGRRKDMKRLFITESLLLSLAGGLVGIIGAILVGFIADAILNGVASSRGVVDRFSLFSESPVLISLSIGFMLFVGLLVAYAPAKRAERIDPIDALRGE